MTHSIATTDESAWLEHHRVIFGRHEWPPNSLLVVCGDRPRFGARGFAHPSESRKLWRLAEEAAHSAGNSYVGSSVLRGTPRGYGQGRGRNGSFGRGRGEASEVEFLAALVADIDLAGGCHKPPKSGLPHPDRTQAAAILEGNPLGDPSLLIDTGGGLHAWWALSDPLAVTPEVRGLLGRWDEWLTSRAEALGVHIDPGVASDVTRVLRPAGTLNRKIDDAGLRRRDPVRILDIRESAVLDVRELGDLLPGATTVVAAPVRVPERRHSPARSSSLRPLDALDQRHDSLPLLLEHLGLVQRTEEPGGESRWIYPRSDGSVSTSDEHALVRPSPEDGVLRLWAFPGTRLSADWAMNGHVWGAASVLVNRLCEGDAGLAARIVARCGADIETILQAVRSAEDAAANELRDEDGNSTQAVASQLAEAFPAKQPHGLRPKNIEGLSHPTVHGTLHLNVARSSDEPMWVPIDPNDARCPYLVVVDKRRSYGLFEETLKWVKDGDDTFQIEEHRRITSWVAWRSSVTSTIVPTLEGTATTSSSGAEYTVDVLTSGGRVVRISNMSADESLRPDRIIAAADAPLDSPKAQRDSMIVRDMLTQLAFDLRAEHKQFAVCGWTEVDGKAIFAAPKGSMTAEGPRVDLLVAPPGDSSRDWLEASPLALVGWPELPSTDEYEDCAKSIAEAFKIAPKNPQLIWGLLGKTFAAPLMLPARAVLDIFGVHGSGKSLAITLTNAYQASQMDPERLGASLIGGLSAPAAVNMMSWSRGLVVTFDDHKVEGVARSDYERMAAVIDAGARMGYGAALSQKATRNGGLRAQPPGQSSTVISGEVPTQPGSTGERIVQLPVHLGDVITQVNPITGEAPFDTWRRRWCRTGIARKAMADYLRWLAEQIDHEGLRSIRDRARQDGAAWLAQGPQGRTATITSEIQVGWIWIHKWAQSRGVAHHLPELDRLSGVARDVANAGIRRQKETSAAERVLAALALELEAGLGHLRPVKGTLDQEGGIPAEWARRWGYSVDNFEREQVTGRRIGWVTYSSFGMSTHAPRCVVVIAGDAMQRAWGATVGPWSPTSAYDAFKHLVLPESNPGGKSPSSLTATENRPRGWVFEASVLGIDPESGVEEEGRQRNTRAV